MNLRQEDMTRAEYQVNFSKLERFAPVYVNTEAKKAKRFQQGLKPGFRSQRESEGKKRKFEESKHDQGSSKFGGKCGKNVGNQNHKFPKFKPGNRNQKNRFQKTGQPVKDNRPKFRSKGHYSVECLSSTGKLEMTCFKYGKVGHMARNCKEAFQKANVLRIAGPPPPAVLASHPRARTFNMSMKDAIQNADVVAGTLVINSVEVKVLMDSGVTRSFIAESVIDRLKFIAYPLESNLIIEVANQERIIANRICPNCDVVIEGRHFSVDLIPFKLGEFDVILGMDWLSNHDAQVECKNKKVKLRTKDGIEVIFRGKKQERKFRMAIQTKRLLRQGCEVYLAHVKDLEAESLRIEDIPVVKDSPDVFPDELPGLPSDREIKFMIN
ncbi:hypothetical protein AgCh_035878 [Apium graveolens]